MSKCKFFDGINATPQEVDIRISSYDIVGFNNSSQKIIEWPNKEIIVIKYPEKSFNGIISAKSMPEARLYLSSTLFEKYINFSSPNKFSQFKLKFFNYEKNLILWSSIALLLIIFFILIIPNIAKITAYNMPKSWEDKIGKLTKEAVVTESLICNNKEGIIAINKIISKLQFNKNIKQDLKIIVIYDYMVNAAAISGNYILIFSGLLNEIESEEELTGILAHEIGHLITKHPTQALIQNLGVSLILSSTTGVAALDLGGFLIANSYSREMEKEADELAIKILLASNINPDGLIKFFERLSKKEGVLDSEYFSYISTHPHPSGRIAYLQYEKAKNYKKILSIKEFKNLKNICN